MPPRPRKEGFVFGEHARAIAAMSACAVAGSFAGTRLRGRLDPDRARPVLKWLITAVCVKNLWSGTVHLLAPAGQGPVRIASAT